MKAKGLYRAATPAELANRAMTAQPKAKPSKPRKGAKKKAKR